MITKQRLDDLEQEVLEIDCVKDRNIFTELISEIRELQHDLVNPNFLYGGTRIHRQAILNRDRECKKLQEEIKDLKKPSN